MVYPSKKEILQQHPLFESLSWWQFSSLASEARIVEIPKGDVILREGEEGDALYIVISGRCEAYTEKDGQRRVLERYHNGDSFGETSLLSGEAIWASVKAINDTLLVKIDEQYVDELTKNNATISRQLGERIASRVKQKKDEYKHAASGQIISIGSGLERMGKTLFGTNMAAALHQETHVNVCLVDFTQHPEGSQNEVPTESANLSGWIDSVSQDHPSGITVIQASMPPDNSQDIVGPFFGTFMTKFAYVFLVLPEGLSPTIMEMYEQSDRIFLLTNLGERSLYQTRLLLNQIKSEFQFTEENLRIILNRISLRDMYQSDEAEDRLNYPVSYRLPEISEPRIPSPLTDKAFIETFPDHRFSVHIKRIARRIGGVSVGLALGAGAARGLAHIGVIRVLEEANVPVDLVAGTSIGAIMAAGWGTGAGPETLEEFAREFTRRGGLLKMSDLSFPPTRSIFRDKRINQFLDDTLGDATFSDTNFPVRIVSTDLNRLETEVKREGLLADAVRESISMPIVFPPIRRKGKYLVDGGVLNPVPVDVLANEGVSRIIAVNPIPPLEVLRENRHSRGSNGENGVWNWIKQSILPVGKGNILDSFMRSLESMQARLGSFSSTDADVVINPTASAREWYEFDAIDTFVEQGEMSTRKHLDEIKSLIKEK